MFSVGIGELLEEMTTSAKSEVVLIAPFVKHHVLSRLLETCSGEPSIQILTRWRPEEVAAGVSDPSIEKLVRNLGGEVWLNDRLHAKYFRCDQKVMIGSANLTGAALGWSKYPNLEVVDTTISSRESRAFETSLISQSVKATAEIAERVEELAEKLPKPLQDESESRDDESTWWPQLREPKDLWIAYRGNRDKLTNTSALASDADLSALALPPNLEREQFSGLVASRLQQHQNIASIEQFIATPRRFGEVRDELSRISGGSREDSTYRWQSLMRWLLEFFPGQYEVSVPRHSEVIQRLEP